MGVDYSFDEDATIIPKWDRWRKSYTIIPRKIHGEWYWLTTTYYRIVECRDNGMSFEYEYEYGTLLDILKDVENV